MVLWSPKNFRCLKSRKAATTKINHCFWLNVILVSTRLSPFCMFKNIEQTPLQLGGGGGGKRVTELGLASVNPLGDPAGGLAINALSIPHNKMQYVADPIFTPGPVRKVKECAVMRYHELWCCHKCGVR